MTSIYTACEDKLSNAIIDRLIQETRGKLHVAVPMVTGGFGKLRTKLPEFVKLAQHIPVVVLTDLDRRPCASELFRDWMRGYPCPDNLLLRIAVREVEAWVLADRERFSEFTSIPAGRLSTAPETLDDPKQTLLNLVWRHSPRPLKQALVTQHSGGTKQGYDYNLLLTRFVRESWRPDVAAANCNSLARARSRIAELAERL